MLSLPPADIHAIYAHDLHVIHAEHVEHEKAIHLRHIMAVIEKHDAELRAQQQAQQALAPLPAVTPSPSQMPVLSEGPPPGNSYEQCVLEHESGGDYSAVNPTSGAGGAFQFLPSTWSGLGLPGLPQDASVAMQNQAFNTLYAQQGSAPWITDGC